MTVDLRTPILVSELRAVNFFNGRFVSGEDLTDEQNAHRAVHQLLGRAVGDGVVQGLEVAESSFDSTAQTPLLVVRAGLAVNRVGEILRLPADTIVRLARPPVPAAVPDAVDVFHTCTPPQETSPLVPSAIYLLTICSSRKGDGRTTSGGMGALPSHCSLRWIVDAVEFQLHDLNVSQELLALPQRLRNGVAYQLFGAAARQDYSTNPFGAPRTPLTLLDALRGTTLTDCEVPLAVLQWQTSGLQFIDLWSVRRRCAAGSTGPADMAFSGRAPAVTEAMVNQFAAQLEDLRRSVADPEAIEGRRYFRFVPPAGRLPVSSGAVKRFTYETFFNGKTCSRPWFVEAADVEAILAESVHYPPVDLDDPEMVWIYFVHENRAAAPSLPPFTVFSEAVSIALARSAVPTSFAERFVTSNTGFGGRPATAFSPFIDTTPSYVLFANANMPFFGDARFHRSHFNFSNFG